MVLIFQLSDESINKIMQFRHGYGDTQEDYLVGSDKLMRSDSYLSKDAHTVRASFANPATGSIDTKATRAALSGETDIIMAIGYTKQQVLLSYSFIDIGEDFKWAIVSRMDIAEVLIVPNSIRDSIIIWSLVILLVIIIISVMLVNGSIVKPLNRFKETLLEIGDNKNLTLAVNENVPLEISQMARSFNNLIVELKDLIEASKQGSSENSSISYELSTTSLGVGKNVEKSVSLVSEATKKANFIKSEIVSSISDAQENKKDIIRANENLDEARN